MVTVTHSACNFETSGAGALEHVFSENYNIRPFSFRHKFAEHPLLQLPQLVELAQSLFFKDPSRVYYNLGRIGVDRGWTSDGQPEFSASQALERIQTADAWMILKGVQVVPEYGALLDAVLREIHEISGRDLDRTTTSRNISVILTSPHRVTPYHMDEDCNYLLQIRGRKDVYVFNGGDPQIVPDDELERFYLGDINAAKYKEHCQDAAHHFDLTPGLGVHVPVTFPHWVKNGSEVSISVSLNFCFSDRTISDLYRVNHYLRRFGVTPTRPGTSALSDRTKRLGLTVLRPLLFRNGR